MKTLLKRLRAPLTLLTLTACAGPSSTPESQWVSLFNGEDYTGWHVYGGETVGKAWKVSNGAMYFDAASKVNWETNEGGDIITDGSYGNYELELEWKISACGNSGIIYNVHESDEFNAPWRTGPEMQVLDNTCHPDGQIVTHRAGDLYDLISVREENVLPAGEWNRVRIVVTEGHVEHWLNGKKQIEYSNVGAEWEAMIEGSKFKKFPGWGTYTSGQISFQDHGDPVWYRNIRLRQLN